MIRLLAIAAMLALAAPTLATAQGNNPHRQRGPGPAAHSAPHVVGPMVHPRGAGVVVGPNRAAVVNGRGFHPGAVGPQFSYRGRMINRIHGPAFAYPRGYGYRRWAIGGVLPALLFGSAYYYADWATLGLPPPQPGFQWVRYGPDLLLVNVGTGQVVDAVYGAFY